MSTPKSTQIAIPMSPSRMRRQLLRDDASFARRNGLAPRKQRRKLTPEEKAARKELRKLLKQEWLRAMKPEGGIQ